MEQYLVKFLSSDAFTTSLLELLQKAIKNCGKVIEFVKTFTRQVYETIDKLRSLHVDVSDYELMPEEYKELQQQVKIHSEKFVTISSRLHK